MRVEGLLDVEVFELYEVVGREEEFQLSEVVGVVTLALDEAVSVVIQSFCEEGLGCFVEDCCR